MKQPCYYNAGTLYYQPTGGKLHRADCRYFVPPGPDAVITQAEASPAFWEQSCRWCCPPDAPAHLPVRLEQAIKGSCTVNVPGCSARSAAWVVPVVSAGGRARTLAMACHECLHLMMDLDEWVEA